MGEVRPPLASHPAPRLARGQEVADGTAVGPIAAGRPNPRRSARATAPQLGWRFATYPLTSARLILERREAAVVDRSHPFGASTGRGAAPCGRRGSATDRVGTRPRRFPKARGDSGRAPCKVGSSLGSRPRRGAREGCDACLRRPRGTAANGTLVQWFRESWCSRRVA